MDNIIYEKEADEKEYFYYHLSNNNVCTPHFHNNLEMIILLKGQQRVIINGVEKVLSKGDIAISNNYDIHSYNTIGVSQMHIFVLGEAFSRRFFGMYKKSFENFMSYNKEAFDELTNVCALIHNDYYKNYNALMKYGIADMIFGILTKHYPLSAPSKTNASKIVEILKFIDENIKADITLNMLSEKFGYAKNYFSALFNEYVGMHLKNYLNMLRIQRVKAMLEKEEGLTKTNAAMSCGFESMNTFYRAWNKYK